MVIISNLMRRFSRPLMMVVLFLIGLLLLPAYSWGQATDRIGTVLAVDGVAEVRAQHAAAWERLRFRDAIFLDDTVRTGADSKMKVLLNDDSIMTLGEQSEMQFTEFLLTAQQRRTIVNLFVGKIRVLTTRLFGAGSLSEVHTPNAVAGIRGSEKHVRYDAATERTTVFCATGGGDLAVHCYILDPNDPTKFFDIPKDHLAEKISLEPPLPPRLTSLSERQSIRQETAAAAPQDPSEVKTTQALRQESTRPTRGGALNEPAGGQAETVAGSTGDIPTGPTTSGILTATGLQATTEDIQLETLTPDTSPATQELIRRSRANVIINFPGRSISSRQR